MKRPVRASTLGSARGMHEGGVAWPPRQPAAAHLSSYPILPHSSDVARRRKPSLFPEQDAGSAGARTLLEDPMASPDPGRALLALSDDLAAAVERAGRSVVAIHARRRIPSSGILWRPGVVVAANHTIRKDDDITVT